jgi:Uma2 family endonuclease
MSLYKRGTEEGYNSPAVCFIGEVVLSTVFSSLAEQSSLADLLADLGGIGAERIRLRPPPGTATEKDLLRIHREEDRLYELVDGVLVEKIMGLPESKLGLWLAHLMQFYLDENDLGELAGVDGTLRLMPRLVRIPDLSFISHDRAAQCRNPDAQIPDLTPDLVVEVLSKGNTPGEMTRKLKEYFFCGVALVWLVDPRRRTVQVSTAPDQSVLLTEEQELTGEPVLPGFRVSVARIFAKTKGKTPSPRRGRGKKKS